MIKAVLDTNVLASGIFFRGTPYQILKAFDQGRFQIVLSEAIVQEYLRVFEILSAKCGNLDFMPILEYIFLKSEMVADVVFEKPICQDPDDDKFLACALTSKSDFLVSGDHHLLKLGSFFGTRIVTARQFLDILPDK